ncbi:MAG: extracellular solute-binding protein, partial [Parcubacteria group bacterium]|nr:extracellular solute-binding protein [Parcubacteria group bacterium]
LTQRDSLGRISRSGAALGTSRNINRSVDILWMLMVQSNVPMVDLTRSAAAFTLSLQTQDGSPVSPGIRALEFYTDFANPAKRVYSWNKGMDYSLDAFAEGETAMMINYAHHLSTIQRKNPALNFSVAPIPQISTEEPAVTYPNYWGAGVKRDLPQAVEEEAWRFLLWFTDRAQSEKYLTESRRPPARRDLLDFHAGDFNLSVFSKQVLTAKSWFQIDDTATATLFADAIEDVVSGKSKPDKALRDVEAQVTLLLSEANRKGLLPKTP